MGTVGMERGGRAICRLAAASIVAVLVTLLGVPAVGLASETGAPVETAAPGTAGSARDGQTLKGSKGAWTGQKPISYSYQWSRCDLSGNGCKDIASASKSAYRATHEDVGSTLRVTVTASNSA